MPPVTPLHLMHTRVGTKPSRLRHQYRAQLWRTVDADAGARQIVLAGLVDHQCGYAQAGGFEVQVNLLADISQNIARANHGKPRYRTRLAHGCCLHTSAAEE